MLIFMHYQVDSKEIKCPFQWWAKHEAIFPILDLLVGEILKIVGSQIEIEKNLFTWDTYKLEKASFTIKNFRKINICEQKMIK